MAALTRANSELLLISRVGAIFTMVGLDGATVEGANTDLNDPIGYGIRQTGGTVQSFVLITSADVATVAESDYDQYLDLAEYRALQNAQGNFDDVDIKVGPRDEKLSQFGVRLEKLLKRKADMIDKTYGTLVGTLSAGVILHDFAEHDEDNIDESGN